MQRSHPDKDPNGKSVGHFGAVSDTVLSGGCSYKLNTFLDEKLKFALNSLTLLEKKNSTPPFWRSSIRLGNFPLKSGLNKAFPCRLLFSVLTKLKLLLHRTR